MGVFRVIGRILFRPYIEPVKRISSDAAKIKGHLKAAREAAKDDKSRYEWIDSTEDGRANIHSSKDAFEILYERGKWDDEQLAAQVKGTKRAKYFALFMLWATFFITGCVLIYSTAPWVTVFTVAMCSISAANFIARIIKCTIFTTQLETRDLINLKQFWARDDRWVRIFT